MLQLEVFKHSNVPGTTVDIWYMLTNLENVLAAAALSFSYINRLDLFIMIINHLASASLKVLTPWSIVVPCKFIKASIKC